MALKQIKRLHGGYFNFNLILQEVFFAVSIQNYKDTIEADNTDIGENENIYYNDFILIMYSGLIHGFDTNNNDDGPLVAGHMSDRVTYLSS